MRSLPTIFHNGKQAWNPYECGVEHFSEQLFTPLRLIVFLGFKNSQTSDGVNKHCFVDGA
jgi:hypothetical protein